jgi:hypothetical protein
MTEQAMTSELPTSERHRQIAYRVEFSGPITKDSEDLYFGHYADPEGDRLGQMLHRLPETTHGLLIPDESIPLVHVEAALESDHRVTTYGMVVALVYEAGAKLPPAVVETGDRWDTGGLHIFLFEDDDAAAIARTSS